MPSQELTTPFCVEGPSIIEFALTASVNIDTLVELQIDDVTVAEAEFSDLDGVSDISILYRGRVP